MQMLRKHPTYATYLKISNTKFQPYLRYVKFLQNTLGLARRPNSRPQRSSRKQTSSNQRLTRQKTFGTRNGRQKTFGTRNGRKNAKQKNTILIDPKDERYRAFLDSYSKSFGGEVKKKVKRSPEKSRHQDSEVFKVPKPRKGKDSELSQEGGLTRLTDHNAKKREEKRKLRERINRMKDVQSKQSVVNVQSNNDVLSQMRARASQQEVHAAKLVNKETNAKTSNLDTNVKSNPNVNAHQKRNANPNSNPNTESDKPHTEEPRMGRHTNVLKPLVEMVNIKEESKKTSNMEPEKISNMEPESLKIIEIERMMERMKKNNEFYVKRANNVKGANNLKKRANNSNGKHLIDDSSNLKDELLKDLRQPQLVESRADVNLLPPVDEIQRDNGRVTLPKLQGSYHQGQRRQRSETKYGSQANNDLNCGGDQNVQNIVNIAPRYSLLRPSPINTEGLNFGGFKNTRSINTGNNLHLKQRSLLDQLDAPSPNTIEAQRRMLEQFAKNKNSKSERRVGNDDESEQVDWESTPSDLREFEEEKGGDERGVKKVKKIDKNLRKKREDGRQKRSKNQNRDQAKGENDTNEMDQEDGNQNGKLYLASKLSPKKQLSPKKLGHLPPLVELELLKMREAKRNMKKMYTWCTEIKGLLKQEFDLHISACGEKVVRKQGGSEKTGTKSDVQGLMTNENQRQSYDELSLPTALAMFFQQPEKSLLTERSSRSKGSTASTMQKLMRQFVNVLKEEIQRNGILKQKASPRSEAKNMTISMNETLDSDAIAVKKFMSNADSYVDWKDLALEEVVPVVLKAHLEWWYGDCGAGLMDGKTHFSNYHPTSVNFTVSDTGVNFTVSVVFSGGLASKCMFQFPQSPYHHSRCGF